MTPAPSKSALLEPEEHVLSTLEADGSRRWLFPKLVKGRLWNARRVVAYVLLAVYSGLPWLPIGGEPAVLFDLPARKFQLFGLTFLPTDTVLLALAILLSFLGIFFVTALFGRMWCGWACPQTVYMEFVFRPIERFFTGRSGCGGKPRKDVPAWKRAAMYATYLVICLHLAQTFLAYFVGTDAVAEWMLGSPFAHPAGFAIVAALTVAMMIDFAFWREQLCIIGCPYGRLQSVLLDHNSLIVAYDPGRGEPRAPLRKSEIKNSANPFEDRGSCIDCGACVHVCPTGIDIRDGLQMECVNCTQCIDACDEIMDKTNQPRGLIRYSSGAALAGEKARLVRPRTAIYGSLIGGLAALFLTLLVGRPHADITLMRSLGRPFHVVESGEVENTMRVKLTNRTEEAQTYSLEVVEPAGLRVRAAREVVALGPGETVTEPLHVMAPTSVFTNGRVNALLRVTDSSGWSDEREWRLLGPSRANQE
ncbi:MAG: cytochrome c oxidase accessory protein CcoG [Planctomycetota bacterium]